MVLIRPFLINNNHFKSGWAPKYSHRHLLHGKQPIFDIYVDDGSQCSDNFDCFRLKGRRQNNFIFNNGKNELFRCPFQARVTNQTPNINRSHLSRVPTQRFLCPTKETQQKGFMGKHKETERTSFRANLPHYNGKESLSHRSFEYHQGAFSNPKCFPTNNPFSSLEMKDEEQQDQVEDISNKISSKSSKTINGKS